MKLTNAFKHLKKILVHKFYVARYCFMCRLYLQGLLHDMSKFSTTEFFESVRYYDGTRSPIKVCKEKNGYSLAWFHHRGRNKHHWEYWVDDFTLGMIPKKMPFKYVLEMVCDYLAAGRAYGGKNFTMADEYAWWQDNKSKCIMHEDTLRLTDTLFIEMNEQGIKETLHDKNYIRSLKSNYER